MKKLKTVYHHELSQMMKQNLEKANEQLQRMNNSKAQEFRSMSSYLPEETNAEGDDKQISLMSDQEIND